MTARAERTGQLAEASEPFEVEPAIGFTEPIIVLPLRVEIGFGIYDSSLIYLVKELRAEGVDAAFFHQSSQRQWQQLRGDVPVEVVLGIGCSVAGSAIWAILRRVFGRILGPDRAQNIRIKVLVERGDGDGSFERTRLEIQEPGSVIFDELARDRERSDQGGQGASSGSTDSEG